MKGTEKKPDDFNPLHRIAVASGAGMTLLTCIGVGVYCGFKIDEYAGCSPYGLMIMSVMGGAAGLWSVIRKMLER